MNRTVFFTAAVLAVSCSHNKDETKPAGGSPELVRAPELPAVEALNDAQIAAILWTGNNAEVEAGQLARAMGTTGDAKDFAGLMIEGHAEANNKLGERMQRLGVAPADSQILRTMKSDHQNLMEDLREEEGDRFDRAYLTEMVDRHQKMLELIDEKLQPNAKNPELIASIVETRSMIEHHLEIAKRLRDQPAVATAR